MFNLNVAGSYSCYEFNLYVLTAILIRFNYMYHNKEHGPIYKSIEALDKMGMDIIETGEPDDFKRYLLKYDNTICGRHPISVFLHVSVFLIAANTLEPLSKYSIVIVTVLKPTQYCFKFVPSK